MIVQKSTHVSQALNDLLAQFHDKPNIAALVSAFLQQVQEAEDMLFDVFTKRTLDVATGAQLDGIGDILGLPRGSLSDTDYRNRLRVQLAILSSSGTTNDLLSILVLRFGPGFQRFKITTGAVAEFVVEYVDGDYPILTQDAQEAASYIKRAKAAGVYAYFVYTPPDPDSQYFSYGPGNDAEGEAFGFDNGAYVGAIEA